MRPQFVLGLLATAVFDVSVFAATFTVTTTADTGPGSFDQAILDANATPGPDNIHFNIGSGPQIVTTGAIPIITEAVVIDGTTQPGYSGAPIVTLDGNGAVGSGLRIQSAAPSTIRGLAIIDMFGAGVRVETGGATITGNYIGVHASGSVAGFNSGPGIDVLPNVDGVVITSNVISANLSNGIQLLGTPGVAASDNNVIQGNIIGLDATGTNDLGNGANGIAVAGGNNNQIGGTTAGAGNVIAGNAGSGISISALGSVVTGAMGNTVQGNRIGTNGAGSSAVPNGDSGVALFGAQQTTIGGVIAGARNVISGNNGIGVLVAFEFSAAFVPAVNTVIAGNFIGTDSTGTAAIGNLASGVFLAAARDTIIDGNVVSGNGFDGIGATNIVATAVSHPTTGTVMTGNFIGTSLTGTSAIPNGLNGISIAGSQDSTIEGNTILFNGGDGITVLGGAGNRFAGNSIDLNGHLGIDLGDDGVTANDSADADAGPNNRQNYPVLTAVTAGSATTVTGTFNSTPARTFRIEFFHSPAADPSGFGEGRTFLGFINLVTDAAGNAVMTATFPPVPTGSVVTATATDLTTLDTSELSNAVAAVSVPPIPIPTLSEWLLILFAALLATGGAIVARR